MYFERRTRPILWPCQHLRRIVHQALAAAASLIVCVFLAGYTLGAAQTDPMVALRHE
jgi:hypothetical protein